MDKNLPLIRGKVRQITLLLLKERPLHYEINYTVSGGGEFSSLKHSARFSRRKP